MWFSLLSIGLRAQNRGLIVTVDCSTNSNNVMYLGCSAPRHDLARFGQFCEARWCRNPRNDNFRPRNIKGMLNGSSGMAHALMSPQIEQIDRVTRSGTEPFKNMQRYQIGAKMYFPRILIRTNWLQKHDREANSLFKTSKIVEIR